jgi:cell volume regulation protein A
LVALFAGIVFGKDGLKFWEFNDMIFANTFANLALVFILFHAGFTTNKANLKLVALPAIGLATWGVIITSVVVFVSLHFILGWDSKLAILLSVIIASTDVAAIFSILRKRPLGHRLSTIIEVESAANDPMAILLTIVTLHALSAAGANLSAPILILQFLWKFASAPVIGFIIAKFVVWLINKLIPQDTGYYHVIMLSTALFTYGLTETLEASGMLAVFTAGLVMGNMFFVQKQGVYNFSSSMSTIANILLFVLLGVLVEPSKWLGEKVGETVLLTGGVLFFVFLSFAARPIAVFLGTVGMRIPFKEKLFISWSGLRGAVPIVLATYPTAYGIEHGNEIFDMVFFVVLLSLVIQGSSLGIVAKFLKLTTIARPEPPYSLEFYSKNEMELGQRLVVFSIGMPDPEGCEGPAIKDLDLPDSTLLLMIARRQKVPVLFKQTRKIIKLLNERSENFGEEAKELVEKAQEIILEINEKRNFNSGDNEGERDIWQVLPPRGDTVLRGWDHVTILTTIGDQQKVIDTLKGSFKSYSKEDDVKE